MPEYQYTDGAHGMTVTHPMQWSTGVVCDTCGAAMWRKPQAVAVLWGGLPPSGGELSPEIQAHMDNIDESREAFGKEHEEHERKTATD